MQTCVHLAPLAFPRAAGEQLVYGDSKGHVNMLLCGTREWPARDLISTDEHQDYINIHKDHSDWVSQARHGGSMQGVAGAALGRTRGAALERARAACRLAAGV